MRAALVAIAAAAAPAHADDHGRVPVMIADGVCDAFMLTIATPLPEDARTFLFFTGLFSQLIAAPIIHGSDDDWRLAGLDFGARLVVPVAGFFIGNAICDGSDHDHHEFLPCLGPAFAGGLAGVASAQILDWVVLSRITHDASPTPRIFSFGARF